MANGSVAWRHGRRNNGVATTQHQWQWRNREKQWRKRIGSGMRSKYENGAKSATCLPSVWPSGKISEWRHRNIAVATLYGGGEINNNGNGKKHQRKQWRRRQRVKPSANDKRKQK